jgi:hypothetical protein
MCSNAKSVSYYNDLFILSHIDTCFIRPTKHYYTRPCNIVILSMFKKLASQASLRFDK